MQKIMFAGGAARLPDQELHQRLEQWHLPERPPRLLQARHDAQLGQAQSARWVSQKALLLFELNLNTMHHGRQKALEMKSKLKFNSS